MNRTLRFYAKMIRRAAQDTNFRRQAWHESWAVIRQYLPGRLVTPRRDYIFCPYLGIKSDALQPHGRWLPPQSLAYRLAAYGILFDQAGRVLLVSDPYLNFGWNLPGGGVNKGETLVDGLRREFVEETGLEVVVGPVIANRDSFSIMPTGRATHSVLHFYLVEAVGGQLTPNGNGFDTSKVAFIDLATVPPQDVNSFVSLHALIEQARLLRQQTAQP